VKWLDVVGEFIPCLMDIKAKHNLSNSHLDPMSPMPVQEGDSSQIGNRERMGGSGQGSLSYQEHNFSVGLLRPERDCQGDPDRDGYARTSIL